MNAARFSAQDILSFQRQEEAGITMEDRVEVLLSYYEEQQSQQMQAYLALIQERIQQANSHLAGLQEQIAAIPITEPAMRQVERLRHVVEEVQELNAEQQSKLVALQRELTDHSNGNKKLLATLLKLKQAAAMPAESDPYNLIAFIREAGLRANVMLAARTNARKI